MKKNQLGFALLILSSLTVFADDKLIKDKPSLEFQGDVKVNSRLGESLKFKTNEPENPSATNESKESAATDTNLKEDSAIKIDDYPGYPRSIVTVNYAPTVYGGKFTYSGVNFNYSNTSVSGVGLDYRFLATPEVFLDAVFSSYTSQTQAGTPGVLVVSDSSISVYDLVLKGSYCYIGANFFSKICPGLDLGYNSFAVLGFKTNTTLEMKKVADFVWGPNIFIQRPVGGTTLFEGRVGYLMGTGSGGSSELTATSDKTVYASGIFTWDAGYKRHWNAGLVYSNRVASLSGTKGSNTDKWDTTIDILNLTAGYGFEF